MARIMQRSPAFGVSSGDEAFVWDLTYFDRHVAEHARFRLSTLRPEGVDEVEAARLGAWADEVLERPWPLFGR